jgi:hypothetical protein
MFFRIEFLILLLRKVEVSNNFNFKRVTNSYINNVNLKLICMKKTPLKNYLKIGILVLGLSLIFQACTKDEILNIQEAKENNVSLETVLFSELENTPLFKSLSLKNTSRFDVNKALSKSISKKDYTVLTKKIYKATYLDYEAYTFRIDNPSQPLFTFDNYVVRKNHDGSQEEFILRYSYDVLERSQNDKLKILTVSQYDTNYNIISSSEDQVASRSECAIVDVKIYHKIPDGRKFQFTEGSVCQHPGQCEVIIEYTISCTSSGGGGVSGESDGEPNGTGGSVGIPLPDNGGPILPIGTLPPTGEEEDLTDIQALKQIIEEPLSLIPSENEIRQKNNALIAYLMESNGTIFQDMSTMLAYNMYDTSLNFNDDITLWHKAKAIYDVVETKSGTIALYNNFDLFFSSLSIAQQESYTKNSIETALFSGIKSLTNDWPQNSEEWKALFKLMSPLLLEIGIEFLPGGGVFNAGSDTLAGIADGDYTTAVVGIVGIIMEFVPWAKLAKIATKIYDVGKSVFKIFKLAYNHLTSLVSSIEAGLKTVLDGSSVKLLDDAGEQVAKITDNILTFKYSGFGGNIITVPDKTTTVVGKWIDNIDGGGTKEIIESGLSKSGRNDGGINALSEAPDPSWNNQQIWDNINEPWLDEAIDNGDVIRVVSNPLNKNNIFSNVDGIPDSVFSSPSSLSNFLQNLNQTQINKLSFYGREIRYLFQNGFTYDSLINQFIL